MGGWGWRSARAWTLSSATLMNVSLCERGWSAGGLHLYLRAGASASGPAPEQGGGGGGIHRVRGTSGEVVLARGTRLSPRSSSRGERGSPAGPLVVSHTQRSVSGGGEGRAQGQISGENPGPRAGTPLEEPLTPCLPPPPPPPEARRTRPRCPPSGTQSRTLYSTLYSSARAPSAAAVGGGSRRRDPMRAVGRRPGAGARGAVVAKSSSGMSGPPGPPPGPPLGRVRARAPARAGSGGPMPAWPSHPWPSRRQRALLLLPPVVAPGPD